MNIFIISIILYFSKISLCLSHDGRCDLVRQAVYFGYIKGNKNDENNKNSLEAINSYKDWLKYFKNRQSFKYQNEYISSYMWVGEKVDNSIFIENGIKILESEIKNSGMPPMFYIEHIDQDPMKTYGIIVYADKNKLNEVQDACKSWSRNEAINKSEWYKIYSTEICYLNNENKKLFSNDDEVGECKYGRMNKRIEITDICKINKESIFKYNYNLDFNTIDDNYPICCSIGKKPNLKPVKNGDKCVTYTIERGDTCETISSKYFPLRIYEIEKYNKNNKNWYSCDYMQWGNKICITEGLI